MRCQFCDGLGTRGKGWYERDMEPCPECGGTGHLHCCEGLREQHHPTMLFQAEQDRPEIPATARISMAVHVTKGDCEDERR